MNILTRFLPVSVVALIVLCGPATVQAQSPDTTGSALALQQCRAAASDLLATLRQTLERQLALGGPARGVFVCADTAQVLSESIAKKRGVEIRRVSDRWRNSLDEPSPYEREVLKKFAAAVADSTLTDRLEHVEVVIERGARVFRYMKPIRIQGMCLACHGDPARMDAGVKKAITERYPDDRAIGYAPGDLRGAVTARMTLPPPGNR